MRITDIEVITFKSQSNTVGTKWGYGQWHDDPQPSVHAITKISTDEGVSGYNTGGMGGYFQGAFPSEVEAMVKNLLIGEDPLSREHLWNLMRDNHNFHESLIGNLDCALWDLAGRYAGMSASQLMGKAREKVRAYASTFPNMGTPEDYAKFALECKAQGYTAFKVHAYIYWNPITNQPAPRRPAFPKQDIEVCEAVHDAVGDEMTLMLDPWGIYTLDESIYVGRELERLGYYFLEHPMHEFRVEPYRRLCNELDIAVCAPEHATWMHYSRAEWVLQGASDIGRIDVNFGGITACKKAVDVYEAFGVPCEMHGGWFGNSAILGATTEETCLFYERGLLRPEFDYEATPPYLNSQCDPMDDEGNVLLPQGHGLGMDFNWDYIDDNRVA